MRASQRFIQTLPRQWAYRDIDPNRPCTEMAEAEDIAGRTPGMRPVGDTICRRVPPPLRYLARGTRRLLGGGTRRHRGRVQAAAPRRRQGGCDGQRPRVGTTSRRDDCDSRPSWRMPVPHGPEAAELLMSTCNDWPERPRSQRTAGGRGGYGRREHPHACKTLPVVDAASPSFAASMSWPSPLCIRAATTIASSSAEAVVAAGAG